MPSLFRLVSIKYSQVAPRRFRYGATLFADGQDVRVAWECAQPDTRLNPGVLVAAALATRRILLPEIKHLGLLHCLTAGVGADFLGIRRPATLEAEILSLADRLSGDSDLFRQNAREQPGLGRYHNHLQGRPFLMEGARVD
jgi:hypothetical protein